MRGCCGRLESRTATAPTRAGPRRSHSRTNYERSGWSSPRDISKILGQGAARSTLKQDQIGTLEPGKLADMVLIDGNPLTDINDLMKVLVTIKGGRIVSDKR